MFRPAVEAFRIRRSPTVHVQFPCVGSKAPQWKSSRSQLTPPERSLFMYASCLSDEYQTFEPEKPTRPS